MRQVPRQTTGAACRKSPVTRRCLAAHTCTYGSTYTRIRQTPAAERLAVQHRRTTTSIGQSHGARQASTSCKGLSFAATEHATGLGQPQVRQFDKHARRCHLAPRLVGSLSISMCSVLAGRQNCCGLGSMSDRLVRQQPLLHCGFTHASKLISGSSGRSAMAAGRSIRPWSEQSGGHRRQRGRHLGRSSGRSVLP